MLLTNPSMLEPGLSSFSWIPCIDTTKPLFAIVP